MQIAVKPTSWDGNLAKLVSMVRNKAGFVKVWANSAAMEARENARKKGGRRWWRDLARSVQVRNIGEMQAEVSSNQVGAVIKQYGGVIRPVRARVLTIPIAPEAKGKRAYEMSRPDRPLFRLAGTRLLGYSTGRGKNQRFKALYVLAAQAVQKPDPWFPDTARVMSLGEREAMIVLRKEQQKWTT